jgi:hypothetical protein
MTKELGVMNGRLIVPMASARSPSGCDCWLMSKPGWPERMLLTRNRV